MFSLTNFFRSATRHRTNLAATVGATRGQNFSSTSASREEDDKLSEPSGISGLSKVFDEVADQETAAAEAISHAPRQERLKGFGYAQFVEPIDFSRGARIDTGWMKRRPKYLLGPGRREAERGDIFRQLDIDPVHEATNSRIMSFFVTEMGKIKPRSTTNLTWRSQRKLGKAIRRARMMGIIPQLSKKVLTERAATPWVSRRRLDRNNQ